MENNYKVIPIFPTPIFYTKLPNSLSIITSFFDKQEMLSKENDPLNYGERSKNTYILDQPECVDLKNYILTQVLKFGSTILNYNYDLYKITQSWISIKHPGQSHISHTHPNSLISGVIYYGDFVDNTSLIQFDNPKLYSPAFNVLRPEYNLKSPNLNPYSYDSFSPQIEPGVLILFESNLLHSVPLNKTNIPRKSLSFNIVPSKGFGSENDLTELKFN